MKKNKPPTPYYQMTTGQLLKSYLISKLPKGKQKLSQEQTLANLPPQNIAINHIAIVLDGVVEDVIRCQNRLAALLLSNPEFVEFDTKKEYPKIGITKYSNGVFSTPEPNNSELTEEKIEELLKEIKKEDE
jgi:hypothetical protein